MEKLDSIFFPNSAFFSPFYNYSQLWFTYILQCKDSAKLLYHSNSVLQFQSQKKPKTKQKIHALPLQKKNKTKNQIKNSNLSYSNT